MIIHVVIDVPLPLVPLTPACSLTPPCSPHSPCPHTPLIPLTPPSPHSPLFPSLPLSSHSPLFPSLPLSSHSPLFPSLPLVPLTPPVLSLPLVPLTPPSPHSPLFLSLPLFPSLPLLLTPPCSPHSPFSSLPLVPLHSLPPPLSQFGETALHWAAYRGHIAIMHSLLKHGANVNIRDNVVSSNLKTAGYDLRITRQALKGVEVWEGGIMGLIRTAWVQTIYQDTVQGCWCGFQ